MKVYVLYISGDYASAIHMSTKKKLCEKELIEVKKRTNCSLWIEEYDFSKDDEYELECS